MRSSYRVAGRSFPIRCEYSFHSGGGTAATTIALDLRELKGEPIVATELETREEAVKSQLALANGPDPVELHPQAAEPYAAKVADIHAALARGDAAWHEAINLVRELITRSRDSYPHG